MGVKLLRSIPALGLRQRMVLGIGLLILLLLMLGSLAFFQTRSAGRQLARIVEGNNFRADLAHRLNAAQLEWMGQVRALIVFTDMEDLKAQNRALEQSKARYAQTEAELAAALEGGSADLTSMRDKLAEVRKIREGMAPALDATARSAMSGAGAESSLTLLLAAERSEHDWRALIAGIVDEVTKANAAEFEAARNRQRVATVALVAVTILAVVVAVFTGTGLVRSVTRPIDEAVGIAERIALGQLDSPIPSGRTDEFGRLMAAISAMQLSLRHMVLGLNTSASAIDGASREIGSGSLFLSTRTEQAASQLQQTSASIRQLTESVSEGAEAARQASTLAVSAQGEAQLGERAVSRLHSRMQDIASVSKRITEIVDVIDSIAFQTNVLALNASIEAARAGEQGKGFAVVAAEVRMLSRRAAEAAGQIRVLSAETSAHVREGEASVADAGRTVDRLVETAASVARTVDEVSATASKQSEVLQQIDGTVLNLDEATQQNAALAEQLTAAVQTLQDRADEFGGIVERFQLGESQADDEAGPSEYDVGGEAREITLADLAADLSVAGEERGMR